MPKEPGDIFYASGVSNGQVWNLHIKPGCLVVLAVIVLVVWYLGSH